MNDSGTHGCVPVARSEETACEDEGRDVADGGGDGLEEPWREGLQSSISKKRENLLVTMLTSSQP